MGPPQIYAIRVRSIAESTLCVPFSNQFNDNIESKIMSGKQVSQSECASVFGVHRNTVAAWVKKNCPVVQVGNKSQGRDWILDTAAVAQWRAEQAVQNAVGNTEAATEDELRCRKLAAEVTIAEIDAAKKRGEVALLGEVEKVWRDYLLEFKARIRQVPTRVAGQLLGVTNETEIKAVLLDEIDETLTVLSDFTVDDGDNDT